MNCRAKGHKMKLDLPNLKHFREAEVLDPTALTAQLTPGTDCDQMFGFL